MNLKNNGLSGDRPQIIISLGTSSLARISKECRPVDSSVAWLYLGNNYLKRKQAVGLLGDGFQLIDISRRIRQTAQRVKQDYVAWQDGINLKYGTDIDWWFGAISSRNIYQSNIFLNICLLEVFKELWDQGPTKPKIIVIDSPGVFQTLQAWANGQGIRLKVYGRLKMSAQTQSRKLYTLLRWGKFWAIQLLRKTYASLSRKGESHLKAYPQESVLLVTTLNDLAVSSQGVFKDSYLPYLHEFFVQKGESVLVFSILDGFGFNFKSILKRLRSSPTAFLIPEDTLTGRDYWQTFKYTFKVLGRRIKGDYFRGFDLSPILREEQFYEDTIVGLEPYLVFCFLKRLQHAGLRFKKAVMWYENRLVDKAVAAGLRQAFPDLKVIGVQGFLHLPNSVSLSPSTSEVQAQITPHKLLTTSDYECQLAKAFCPQIPCQAAAALRFQHLFSSQASDQRVKEDKTVLCILVLLPYSIAEGIEILDILDSALPGLGQTTRFLIKAHPDFGLALVKNIFGIERWPKRFEDFNGKLKEGLGLADMAISSTSSSMIEAVSLGIPVIFVGGQTSLEENLMFGLNSDMIIRCFNASELTGAVHQFSRLSTEQIQAFKQEGRRIRDHFFLPLNAKTLEPFGA